MNKKKEIQRRYGSNMSDAQYLAIGSALDDLQEHIIDKATQWLFENVYDYLNSEDQERVESFRKAMEE